MKGWLDKYGKEINANEGHSSAQENWEGEGYSNVGRNYSPAWGGQFQKGGRQPIYTEDPRKVKAYQDSLSLYNKGVGDEKFLREHGMTNAITHKFPFSKVTSYSGYANKPKGKIQPTSAVSQTIDPSHPNYYRAEWLKYKKPVQPYILQEPSLKKKVTKEELKSNKTNTSGITELQHPDVQIPPIQQGKYRVEYFDPSLKEETHRMFMTQAESDAYADELSKRNLTGVPSAGNITQRVEYQKGGELTSEQLDSLNKAKMKSKMALASEFGNPAARRMMNPTPPSYRFSGNEMIDGQNVVGFGENQVQLPATGTHYMGSMGEYAVPYIQQNASGNLQFNPNASPDDREAMKFDNPQDAEYFAEHYKEVAPMMRSFAMGGSLPGSVGFTYARTGSIPSNGPYAKKTKASAQKGDKIPIDPTKDSRYTQPISGATQFMKDWMNSPMYEKMLRESVNKDKAYDYIKTARENRMGDGNISYYEDSLDPGLAAITHTSPSSPKSKMYFNKDAYDSDLLYLAAHELSHVNDAGGLLIPREDVRLMSDYATHNVENSDMYEKAKGKGRVKELSSFIRNVNEPTETRARLTGLRKISLDQGLYDPFTQPFNLDMLKKYKQLEVPEGGFITDPYYQLRLSYTDEEIADMMNKISKVDNKEILPIAQNGQEMSYYQHGLDWKPNRFKLLKQGGVIEDDMGQWAHPGKVTKINSNQITMKGVPYPVLGISDTGHQQMMYPGEEYKFKGKKVTEFPMAQNGKRTPIYTDDPRKVQNYNDSLTLSKTKSFLPVNPQYSFNKSEIDDIIKNNRIYGSDIYDDPKNREAAKRLSKTHDEYNSVAPIWNRGVNIDYRGRHIDSYVQTFKKPVQPYKLEKPSLKRKPVDVEPIKSKSSGTPGLKPMLHNAVEQQPVSKRGEYRVSYYDPQIKDWNENAFQTEKESNTFASEMSGRGYGGSYGNVTQTKKVNKKKTGGWLEKYN